MKNLNGFLIYPDALAGTSKSVSKDGHISVSPLHQAPEKRDIPPRPYNALSPLTSDDRIELFSDLTGLFNANSRAPHRDHDKITRDAIASYTNLPFTQDDRLDYIYTLNAMATLTPSITAKKTIALEMRHQISDFDLPAPATTYYTDILKKYSSLERQPKFSSYGRFFDVLMDGLGDHLNDQADNEICLTEEQAYHVKIAGRAVFVHCSSPVCVKTAHAMQRLSLHENKLKVFADCFASYGEILRHNQKEQRNHYNNIAVNLNRFDGQKTAFQEDVYILLANHIQSAHSFCSDDVNMKNVTLSKKLDMKDDYDRVVFFKNDNVYVYGSQSLAGEALKNFKENELSENHPSGRAVRWINQHAQHN